MAEPQAIIFDFDGVLLESEYEGNRMLAGTLAIDGQTDAWAADIRWDDHMTWK